MYHRITDNLSLKHISFWQPSLMRPMSSITNDYVVSSITSLSTKITSNISFDLVFDYEYHSLVPDGVKQQDIVTSILLRLDL